MFGTAGGEQGGGGVPAAWRVEAQRRCSPGGAVMALVPICRAVRVQLWFGMLRAKALAGVCWWDDGGVLDVVLPVGGVILERQPCCTGFSG